MTKLESGSKMETKSTKTEKDRPGRRSHKKEKQKPQTKIIIRHLPPTMTEEEFLKQIDPLPPHDYFYYATADWSLGFDATCRAYITMKNYDDVFLFRDRFDGYVFVDSNGAEYPAIVEFAPFQGLLKSKSRRSDNKVNTIEQEPHFQQFIKKLEEEREAAAKGGECKLEFSLDRKKEEKITSTPLLQYLANKKEKRREEAKRRQEEKRRQREEEKEKRKQGQQQVTKIISNQEGNGTKGSNSGKSAGGKESISAEKGNQQQEEVKNSRSQRRAERNQRRREEFERRRQEREQREKDAKVNDAVETKTTELSDVKPAEQPTTKTEENKQPQRKEGKRYSERRERERNRNRKDKEKDKQKDQAAEVKEKNEISPKSESTTSKEITAAAVASVGGETTVSESVLNFIRSVATAKEFVPKHKQLECSSFQLKQTTDETKEEIDQQKKDEKVHNVEQKRCDSDGGEDTRSQRQRANDEQRRIRNKDRPSIAIYQPKARLRMSEEREPTAQQSGKGDPRSNPTSDCESIKKEETRSKKISRYSERRAERRINREKQANENKDVLNKTDQQKSNETGDEEHAKTNNTVETQQIKNNDE